jgi:hypothetical protein
VSTVWVILAVAAVIALLVFFAMGPNAVWGGATIGIVVGVLWKLIGRTNWNVAIKVVVVGILLGVGAELVGRIANRLGGRA